MELAKVSDFVVLYHSLLRVHSRYPDSLARDFLVVGKHDPSQQQGQASIDRGRLQAVHQYVQRH